MKKAFLTILSCLMIAACGVKPDAVDPPEGIEHDTFPRTYPDLATDPHPEIFQQNRNGR